MIHIGLDFIRAYSPSEQLIMLHLLLHADENGNVDFCERSISRATEVSYKICRNIHQRFKSEGIIKGAPKGALQGALGEVVTICDFDSYSVLTKIRAQVVGALQGALKEVEITKDKEKDFPHTPLQRDIENNKDEDIKEEESNDSKKKEEELISRLSEMEKEIESLEEENKKLKEEKEKREKKKSSNFIPPTIEEVDAYITEKGFHFTAEAWMDHYSSVGWMVGKNKMKDWKAACRTWENGRREKSEDPITRRIDKSVPEFKRFAEWVDEYYPLIRDMEMPDEQKYNEMKKMVNGDFVWACDNLQDDYHTGSLYDLFKDRFGSN